MIVEVSLGLWVLTPSQMHNQIFSIFRKRFFVGIEPMKLFPLTFLLFCGFLVQAQDTQIRGFVDFGMNYKNDQVNFTLGEQDLFITSEISDRVSFLGETVFKYSANSPTRYDLSIERIILKYNIKGNHNILFGKHHTPVNYWNDSYHHGRVFFPTIFRPMMFEMGVVPLHTTGLRFQGQNLGKLRFGYDALIGNGEASTDALDFNKMKSVMLGAHITPRDGLRIGLSYYYDDIPQGAVLHHSSNVSKQNVKQSMYSGSVSYFGSKFELLAESSVVMNQNDSTGTNVSPTGYIYAGYRTKYKFVPYVRVDVLNFSSKEVLFSNKMYRGALVGLRYEINYLAVLKLEYNYTEAMSMSDHSSMTHTNAINFQFAIGF
jgi:hypothetical protein